MVPYCSGCHKFMRLTGFAEHPSDEGGRIHWRCNCLPGQEDMTKDPNCLNSHHAHHDPESPIMLGNKRIREAEERADAGCKGEDGLENNEFSFDTIAELDEILEETNRQVEVCDVHTFPGGEPVCSDCGFEKTSWEARAANFQARRDHCLLYGHVWVRVGTVTAGVDFGAREAETVSVIDWGPVTCLRCGEPAPEGVVEGPVITITERGMDVTGKHACPGCNLRDLTMADAKRHLRHLLIEAPNTKARREAERWLRLDGKIRAMKED